MISKNQFNANYRNYYYRPKSIQDNGAKAFMDGYIPGLVDDDGNPIPTAPEHDIKALKKKKKAKPELSGPVKIMVDLT